MDTQTATRTRLCRSYEDFIEELRKESDFEVNVPAHCGRHTQAMLQASVCEDGKDCNKKKFESAWLGKDSYKREAKLRNGNHTDGEVKDLLLLGLFCCSLFVLNLACWNFFAGAQASRLCSLLRACFHL